MKKALLFLPLFIFLQLTNYAQSGYDLKVKITGLKDTSLYLAGYYGPKQYYKDTAKVDKNGNAVFKSSQELEGGIYSIVLPDQQTYFEFVLVDPNVTIETKKGTQQDMIDNLVIKGSKDAGLFAEYLKFVAKKQKESDPYRKAYMDSSSSEAKKDEAEEELKAIEKEVTDYKLNLMEENPTSFVTKMFKASQEPEIPEEKDWPTLENGKKDSTFPRKFYLENYWKNIDFSDDRILRTPIFHQRLQKYVDKVVLQHPDTVIKSSDALIEKAKASKEMFKYIVHYITNKYERSEIMCMDKVFVHLGEKYYVTGQAFWMDSTKLAKVVERVTKMKPTICQVKTPNVILQDTTEKNWVSLYDVDAKFTVLYFWDSGCSHCKKETPKLKKLYDKFKDKGVAVYAVGTEFETGDWKKYIKKNELDWINVSDNPEINKNAYKYLQYTTVESLNFRDTYDIFSTPRVFLLDENKTIIAKRIGVDQLEDLLNIKLGLKKDEGKEIIMDENHDDDEDSSSNNSKNKKQKK